MQETNNFTNLTRLSSFLLLDMLLLIDMTWNTHLSAKNTQRKKNILGDRETREESIGKRRRSWTTLDLTGFRLMRRVAHGRSRSLACRESRRTSPSDTPEAQHGCTIAFALQQWHVAFSGGSSFFTNRGRPFFCFASFLFFSLFRFFFFGTRLLTLRNLRYVATRLHTIYVQRVNSVWAGTLIKLYITSFVTSSLLLQHVLVSKRIDSNYASQKIRVICACTENSEMCSFHHYSMLATKAKER